MSFIRSARMSLKRGSWSTLGCPLTTLLVALLATAAVAVLAQGPAEMPTSAGNESLLVIDNIRAEPSRPAPDAPFRLKLRLRNKGKQSASDFEFQIDLNGQPVALYSNHVWALAPGQRTDVHLYGIATSEPGRPAPDDGRLLVTVRLTAARWHGSYQPANLMRPGQVAALPPPCVITVTMSTRKGP